MSDVPDPHERAAELADQALQLDKTLAEPHELLALNFLAKKQFDRAVAAAERAAAIEPNDPEIHYTLAYVRNLAGKHEEALAAMGKGIRSDPIPPIRYLHTLGIILYFVGRPEEAIPPLKKVFERTQRVPSMRRVESMTLVFLIASYVAAGRMEEAERQAAYFNPADPVVSLSGPYKLPADGRRVLDDLAKAGVKILQAHLTPQKN